MLCEDARRLSELGSHVRDGFRSPSALLDHRAEVRSCRPEVGLSDRSSPHVNPPSHLRGLGE
jgi:hypothetical protein